MSGKQTLQRVLLGTAAMTLACGVIALQAVEVATAVVEETQSKELTGTVVKACPAGCVIKIKTADDKVVGFTVAGKPAKEAVKALKKGEAVKLTIVKCPKTKKDTVSKVAKVVAGTTGQ